MVFLGRVVVSMAAAGFFASPLRADVIPSQYASTSDAKSKVQARLAQMGVSEESAKLSSKRLTEEEAAYFAYNPSRVQLVGQEAWAGQADIFWWEWLLGLAALVGVGAWIYLAYNVHGSP
jgi:hypothetical protein